MTGDGVSRPGGLASAASPPSPRAIARRRLARIAVAYAALTAVMVVVNLATHGPSWWYFAAAGFALAIAMQGLRLRR